jgi:hypothetical protein
MRAMNKAAFQQFPAACSARPVLAAVRQADAAAQRGLENRFVVLDAERAAAGPNRDAKAHTA